MIKDIIALFRIKQWYKNLLIFLPLVFGRHLFEAGLLSATILGFVSLCFISSSGYIINDIIDRKKDRNNPEKRNRPLASGKIKVLLAALISTILFIASMWIAISLSLPFAFFTLSLFVLTQFYSIKLKHIVFADLLAISVNFVIRTVSGNFIFADGIKPYISVSYWLVLCPFFLALFLAVSKRQSEVIFLKENAKSHRSVLGNYTKEITSSLMIISTTLLIMSYAIYVIFGPYPKLIFTLPFVLYIIFSLFFYAEKGTSISRNAELIFKDKKMLATMLFVFFIVLFVIYGINLLIK